MKHRYGIAVAGVLAVVLMASMPLRADENANSKKDKSECKMCKLDEGGRHEHFKKMLGLTDDQAKKFEALKKDEKTAMKPLRDQVRTLSKKLEWQIAAKASDDDIKSTLDEARSARESMVSSMKKYRTQMDDILTPTQQAKLLVFKSKMMERKKYGEWKHHKGFGQHEEGWGHHEVFKNHEESNDGD
jgi:Spy/CpxP family protein refolding chaperone